MMADRPVEQQTLREIFANAEWMIRDLTEHLKQSFYPRIRSLAPLVATHDRPAERDDIPDSSVRTHVAALLSSDDYSQTIFQKLEVYLSAIEHRSQAALQTKSS
ncbi:MAG TPA: hypothetical protein VKU82_01145 [Planctomycetaceae bacterium]|nr:hypothetical protein [Planctomycetaceae bacterium]